MFSISARLEARLDPNDLLNEYGLEKGGRVQRFIDQKVIDGCRDYVPASPNQVLKNSAQSSTEIGSGQVIWNTPYAHYQYMGIVYGPNIPILDPETGVLMGYFSPPGRPKHPTDKKLTYDTDKSPMAGSHWFERAKADQINEWLDEARRVMIQGE